MESTTTSTSSRRAHPVRTCLGCRHRADKADLVRVVAVTDEATTVVVPDLRGSAEGRGAYVHPALQCLDKATRRKAFGRALRVAGAPDVTMLSAYVGARSKLAQTGRQ